jgi:hypothetical protein
MSTIVKVGCLSALQVLGLSLAASIFWSCLSMVIYVSLYIPTGLSATYDEVLPHEKYARNRPIIPVSCESNEPIVEWTDNKILLIGAFPDKFLFGQGVPTRLPTHQNWKHFSLYYDG